MTEQTEENRQYKVILNVHMADKLIKAGFQVVEVKPSSQIRGRAAFIFEHTPEFNQAMYDLAYNNKK